MTRIEPDFRERFFALVIDFLGIGVLALALALVAILTFAADLSP
jgi:hypothetical protein